MAITAAYQCWWSAGYIPPPPLAVTRVDTNAWIYIDELPALRKQQFFRAAKKLNPEYYKLITNDDFVHQLINQFGASIVIQRQAFNRAMSLNIKDE